MADSKLFSNLSPFIGLGANFLGGLFGQREIDRGIGSALNLSQPANINTPFASTAFNGNVLTNTLSPQAQGIFSGMLDASAANLASASVPSEAFAKDFSEGLFRLVEGQEAEARSRELDKLNAQGRFGTTGGTAQYGELLQGQAMAGLSRALTSENLAFQRQSEMFNRAINLANTAGNLSQANLALSLQGRNNAGAQLAAQGGAAKGDFISSIFGSFGNAALEAAGIENPLNAAAKSIFQALGLGGAGPTIASNAGALGGSFSGGAGAATGLGEATAPLTGANAGDGFLSSLFGGGGGALAGGTGTGGALTGGIAAEGAFTGAAPSFAGLSGFSAAIPAIAPLGILGLSQIGAGPAHSVEAAKIMLDRGNGEFFKAAAHSPLQDLFKQAGVPAGFAQLSPAAQEQAKAALGRPGTNATPVTAVIQEIREGRQGGSGQFGWVTTWSDGETTNNARRGNP